MGEALYTTPESLPVAQQVGRKVLVAVEVRLHADEPWRPANYQPWTGIILTLPEELKRNGYVNVMPDEPRGEHFPSLYPRTIDLSARNIEDTTAQMRHVLHAPPADLPGNFQ